MKFVLALVLFVAAAAGASLGNESDLKPRHIYPRIPRIPFSELDQRITNGDIAKEGQFPYQAALRLDFPDGRAFCGGSIISDRWILTAAHCTDEAIGVTVTVGITNLNEKQPGEQEVYVSKSGIIVHAKWDPATIQNDIALIKLPTPITLTAVVQPVGLPKKSETYSNYVGDLAVASGFGKASDSSTTVSPELRYIVSPVISKLACNIRYFGLIQDSNICISGENGRSTCNGDSGGPLVYQNVQIGLTSFGIALGCEVGWPAVFTRVTSFLDWIETQTGIKL